MANGWSIPDPRAGEPGLRGELFVASPRNVQPEDEDEIAGAPQSLGAFGGSDGGFDYGAAALHLLRIGDVDGAAVLARAAAAVSPGRNRALTRSDRGTQNSESLRGGLGADGRGTMPATRRFPRLTTRAQVLDALREARAARASGKDPALILKRLHDLGIGVSSY